MQTVIFSIIFSVAQHNERIRLQRSPSKAKSRRGLARCHSSVLAESHREWLMRTEWMHLNETERGTFAVLTAFSAVVSR